MSTASYRNFVAANAERQRRNKLYLDDPSMPTVNTAPAWDAFYGSLHDLSDRAHASGMDLRVDQSGLGHLPTSATLENPNDAAAARSFAVNSALSGLMAQRNQDETARRIGTAQAQTAEATARGAQREQEDIGAVDQAGANATLGSENPMVQRERLLQSIPPHLRPQYDAHFAAEDQKAAAAQLNADKLAEVTRHNKATEADNSMLAPVIDPHTGAAATGPAALSGIAPPIAKQVQALADGRMAFPTGTALKTPYWQKMLGLVAQFDPSFDAINYNARASTRKDFTSGAASKQINAINTVVGHLHDLAHKGEGLGNTGMDWANSVMNKLTPGGSKRGVAINDFETLKEGVATELMRVWRQAGVGSEKEIEDWKATIGSSKSPQELKGAFGTIGGMLESKLDALDSQYKQGMGTQDISAITPESRQRLDALKGGKGSGGGSGAGAGSTVKLRAPNGAERDVSIDQVDHYLKLGATKVGS